MDSRLSWTRSSRLALLAALTALTATVLASVSTGLGRRAARYASASHADAVARLVASQLDLTDRSSLPAAIEQLGETLLCFDRLRRVDVATKHPHGTSITTLASFDQSPAPLTGSDAAWLAGDRDAPSSATFRQRCEFPADDGNVLLVDVHLADSGSHPAFGDFLWPAILLVGLALALSSAVHEMRHKWAAGRRRSQRDERARPRTESETGHELDFLTVVSHELRTPLHGISSAVELLSFTELDAEQRDLVRSLGSCGRTLLSLVNNLLDYSELQSGRVELAETPFEPLTVLRQVITRHQQPAEDKGLLLTLEAREPLPSLLGDGDRLRRALDQLVENAVKFTRSGAVRVRARWTASELDDGRLRVEVTDTGVGIREADRDRIFEAFRQADARYARDFEGTGLGLALARGLARKMGGDVSVTSERGKGSRFTFEAPFERAPAPGRKAAADSQIPLDTPA